MYKIQNFLPSPLVVTAFFLSFICACIVYLPIFNEPDMGWHIVAGDVIRKLGKLPEHDIWSFVKQEQIWYNLSWAWDVILSFIHQKTSMEGIFVFAKICPSIVVAGLVYCLEKRKNIGLIPIMFTALITFFCMMEFAYGRPQIFGLGLLLVFHHLLHKSREYNQAKNLFILPVLVVLWVNVHGSFFLAALPLGAFGLEAIYKKNWKWLKHLLNISVLCCLATLVNPYGIYVYYGVMCTINGVIEKYLIEWTAFSFGQAVGATMWLSVFVYVSNLRTSTAPFADKILAIVCLFGAFLAMRNVGVLAVLGAPYLAANISDDNENHNFNKKHYSWIENYKLSPFLALVALLTILGIYFKLPVIGKNFYYEDSNKSPVPTIEYVIKNYAGKNVLNDYGLGGRIIYETAGKLPIFIDGRAGTAYDQEFILDYISFMNQEDGWQERTIEKYKIDILLLDNNSSFVDLYRKGLYRDEWEQVFNDYKTTVYEKKYIATN